MKKPKKWHLWVLKGLSPVVADPGGGYLTGRTHQQIATSIKTRFGEDVEPWQVKYLLQKVHAHPAGRIVIARARGRRQHVPTMDQQRTQAIGQTLLRLTGNTTSKIFRRLKASTDQAWPVVHERDFRELLSGMAIEKPARRSVDREHPLWRSQLVIHPLLSWSPDQAEGWLWLLGYECDTEFIHLEAFHLISRSGLKGRGRPITPPSGDPVLITGSPGALHVRVPDTVLASFIDTCQQRLCLPLKRFRLPESCQGLLSDGISEDGEGYDVTFDHWPASEIGIDLLPVKTDLPTLWGKIAACINCHNELVALHNVVVRWSAIQSILNAVKHLRPKVEDNQRTRYDTDQRLAKFYQSYGRAFTGSISAIDLRLRRLRVEAEIANR